jgi:putative acetyltransferase
MIVVREEQPGEASLIDAVLEAAFGRRDEARLVDALRKYGSDCLSLVVVDAGVLIATAVLTPVTIDGAPGIRGLGLGPVAVAPAHQRRGVGTALVRNALQRSMRQTTVFAVVLGDPAYYGRFGFKAASRFGLSDEFGAPDGAFQAVEFSRDALKGVAGTVRYAPEFSLVSGRR